MNYVKFLSLARSKKVDGRGVVMKRARGDRGSAWLVVGRKKYLVMMGQVERLEEGRWKFE